MKRFLSVIVFMAAVLAAIAAAGCASSESSTVKNSAGAAEKPAYYTGDGGKGKSLAITAPGGQGLSAAENYLPAMVQGSLVSDFRKFSNIDILDRQNLDKLLGETESTVYAESADVIRFGEVEQTQYILDGSLIKTASGYTVTLNVRDNKTGQTAASYSGDFPPAEMDNLQGVKRATEELLSQMGVKLTEAGKNALFELDQNAVNAERALARGITAQKSGAVIEAQSYYYEAARFDPSLGEAASRGSVLSRAISGGNLGDNIRNELQLYDVWKKTIDEAVAFFKEHLPFEIVYNPTLTQGGINFSKETADLSFEVMIVDTTGLKIIDDLQQGLNKTGKGPEWGLSTRSIIEAMVPGEGGYPNGVFVLNAALIDEKGAVIGRATGRVGRSFSPLWNRSGNYYIYDLRRGPVARRVSTVTFQNVDANKISDKLTVSIVSVNGIDAKAAGERGYIGIFPENFSEDKQALSADGFLYDVILGDLNIIGYSGPGGNVVIPAKIGRRPVVSIDGNMEAFRNKGLTGVTIPNSVTSIGEEVTFLGNPLVSVTLPSNVLLNEWTFGSEFFTFYTKKGQKAGTYTVRSNFWLFIGWGAPRYIWSYKP